MSLSTMSRSTILRSLLISVIIATSSAAEQPSNKGVNQEDGVDLAACARRFFPGFPGRDGRDGRDGSKGDVGPKGDEGKAGPPGIADSSVLARFAAALARIDRLEENLRSVSHVRDFGTGKDGSLTVKGGETHTVGCAYVSQTSPLPPGSRVFTVNSCSLFKRGDEIVIHQTQHPTQAGMFEYAVVQSCLHNRMTLANPLSRPFESGTYNGITPKVAQIAKVPHFVDVNVEGVLEPGSWDGHCGGIVAIRANGTFTVGGHITATGKGFRGAPKYDSPVDYRSGYVGESELIGYQSLRRAAGVGSGGGAGNGQGGGYGGAHLTVGSTPHRGGCDRAAAGRPSRIGYGDMSFVYFGGSGGASGSHGSGTRDGAEGGASGGIILIFSSGTVTITGLVEARGLPGRNGYRSTCCAQPVGGGGGGAGGSVQLISRMPFFQQDKVAVSGGSGGSESLYSGCNPGGAGGSGGDGRIQIATQQ